MLAILVGSVGASFTFGGGDSTSDVIPATSGSGGVIARFNVDRNGQEVPQPSSGDVAAATTENQSTVTEPRYAETELELQAPDEWALTDTQQAENGCDPTLPQVVSTYQKDAVTLVVYENARPGGCASEVLGDIMVGFAYVAEGLAIESIRADEYVQCTIEQNPTCPRGDGRVTLFIESLNAETQQPQPHPITSQAYAFSMVDTTIGPNLNDQVNQLLDVIDLFTFVSVPL